MTKVDLRQFGFTPGKSTVDAIFIARQLMEKGIEENLESYWGFVDLENAYDRVPREVIYWSLRRKGVPEKLVRLIQETYRNTKWQCAQRQTAPESLTSVLGSTRGRR